MTDVGTIFTAILTAAGGVMLVGADLPLASDAGYPTAISSGQGNISPSKLATQARHSPVKEEMRALDSRRGEDGRLYVSGKVNETPLDFIVDTAASKTAISLVAARASNVTISGSIRIQTAGGIVPAYEGIAESLELGSTSLKGQRVLIIKDLPVSLLGIDVLQKLEENYIVF